MRTHDGSRVQEEEKSDSIEQLELSYKEMLDRRCLLVRRAIAEVNALLGSDYHQSWTLDGFRITTTDDCLKAYSVSGYWANGELKKRIEILQEQLELLTKDITLNGTVVDIKLNCEEIFFTSCYAALNSASINYRTSYDEVKVKQACGRFSTWTVNDSAIPQLAATYQTIMPQLKEFRDYIRDDGEIYNALSKICLCARTKYHRYLLSHLAQNLPLRR